MAKKYGFKNIISLLLTIVLMVTMVFSIPMNVNAIESSAVKSKLDALIAQYPAGNSHSYQSCWYFVRMLSNSIFGHSIPPQASNHYQFKDISTYNYQQIGNTLTISSGNLTESSLKSLFSSSKCGDVIQMDYTHNGSDSLHVMMVYSVSSTGVVFYHAGSPKDKDGDGVKETKGKVWYGASSGSDPLYGTTGKELSWANFKKYFVNSDDGISLYRSKTVNTCSHSYGGTGICSNCNYQFPYDNDRNTSYAGTYKVKSGATAYIRKGPYQKCTEVTRATSGNFTVVARVLNCKGNYWYELSYNGSTCYVVSTNLEKVSHTHSYSYGYESAHPHKQYKSCSCGEYSYTGSTRTVSSCTTCYPQASYGSTNPDDYVYPDRSLTYTSPTMKGEDVAWVQSVLYQLGYSIDVDGSYGKNSVATIKQFQTNYGLTVDGHCGPATRAKLLELWNAKKHTHSYSSTYADANHPHKEYKQCSCGDKQYTGSNYASWEGSSYEAAHPHRVYRTCWCGYYEYTGDYETVGTCNDCINDSFTTRSRCNNRTYDVYMISTTWAKAKEFCESKGGHLMVATDKTKEENAHMSSLIYGNVCWISGSQNRYMYAGVTTNQTTTANMFICEYDPYTVSFEANGGEGTPEPVLKAHDETAYLYTTVPTREGYKFIGWSTDPNATAGSYWYGSSYTANSNITLYAIWRTESFSEKHDYDDNLYYYSYKIDGVNTNRGVASVILYNQSYGSNTMTNEYGCEASVDSTGKVISNVYGVGSATIPNGGFVLSSHSAQDNIFVTDYVKVGDYVYFDSSSEIVYVFPTQEKMKAFLKCRYGHSGTEVVKNNVEPTYDTFGYSGDTCCSVCNELMFRGQYLDMLIRNGDIDNDGIVDNLDRLSITRYLAGWEEYTEESVDIEASDLNNDGFVDNLDRLILTRHLANWSGYEELPYTG